MRGRSSIPSSTFPSKHAKAKASLNRKFTEKGKGCFFSVPPGVGFLLAIKSALLLHCSWTSQQLCFPVKPVGSLLFSSFVYIYIYPAHTHLELRAGSGTFCTCCRELYLWISVEKMTGEKMSALKQLIKAKKEKKKRQEKETNRFFLLQNLNYKDAAHPLLRVDVYLGIKELVTVVIFP